MQALCREFDALFILDEVQTGVGLTGTAWVYQQLGLAPDVVAFGKKTQVCGVMAGGRVDEVPDNVFRVASRINSTWGGNLTDMVRSRRILEVIEADGLIERAAALGEHLLAGAARPRRAAPRAGRAPARPRADVRAHAADGGAAGRGRPAAARARSACSCSAAARSSLRFRPALTVTRGGARPRARRAGPGPGGA